MIRRARIVCTLGPATASDDVVRALVEAGMDVARLNLSHGTHADHAAALARVRAAADAAGRAVAVLADLQGPKIRLGRFAAGPVTLAPGDTFALVTGAPFDGDATRAWCAYGDLARDLRPGDPVLLDDGRVRLEVLETDGVTARCRVLEGGALSDHKGVNLPGVRVSAPALTAKDEEDLRWALAAGADLVALSFVRSATDAAPARRVMDAAGVRVPLFAKLEKPEAVQALEDVLDAFDGLMVARGDLGVEMPLEDVPLTQKVAIRQARERAKPVIVATQMLESMTEHERPTRAEVSDVANAVLDGADALMLSGETSVGRDPARVVRTMARIVAAAEAQAQPFALPSHARREDAAALAAAAVTLARDAGARALVAFTTSGATALRIAALRPAMPLLAFTPDPAVRRRLAIAWGVETFVVPAVDDTDAMVAIMDAELLARGLGATGERFVILAGTPPGVPGSTNTVRLHRLGAA